MRRSSPLHSLLVALPAALIGLAVTPARAQTVELSDRCGDDDARALLRDELLLHAPAMEGWTLAWTDRDDGCALLLSDPLAPVLALQLPANAAPDQLRSAVVRAAWFIDTHAPRTAPPKSVEVQAPPPAPTPAPLPFTVDLQLTLQRVVESEGDDRAELSQVSGGIWARLAGRYALGLEGYTLLSTPILPSPLGRDGDEFAELSSSGLTLSGAWSALVLEPWSLILRGGLGVGWLHYRPLESAERALLDGTTRVEGTLGVGVRYAASSSVALEAGVSWRDVLVDLEDGLTTSDDASLYGVSLQLALLWSVYGAP